ncbi:TonB-dependent receptor domain-containing protein [Algibacter pacificus]|uniref:TonB-dependent receptor domain-containing protein n=1 Tax=Algibacter pacificus TaxID=2599389 RepID=UPI0011C704AE|nr:outer membrane beta-barrel family protein [Algibacter pacificus]
MYIKLHKTIVILLFFLGCLLINAQNSTIEITGKVIETDSKLPIEYATISILDSGTNQPITGTITNENGVFSIDVKASNFYIEISFLGFTTKTFKDFKIENRKINLKTISLSEDLEALGEVLVRAEKSQTEFKLDKRIFNVGSDLSATGAGALEVLNNVPSVNVSIEGEVSLRGNSGVQILINGKPSVLASADGNALGTITADMIEKIEVITNPSAKYDAAGTSGIINIVIKKSDKKGLNGSVSLNAGIPNSNSFGLSLNRRTEKFNLFSQIGFGLRTYPGETESINRDLIDNTEISSLGDSEFDEKFSNFLIGTDYHINDRNVITLSGSYAYENEDQSSQQNYIGLNRSNNTVTDAWLRDEKTQATNPKLRYELQYKKDFKRHKDQSLLFSALGSSFKKDQTSNFINTTSIGDYADAEQNTRTNYELSDYTFKLDYVHPFLEHYTIETGSQYVINQVSNDFAVSDFDDGVWVDNTDLTNIFNFDQNVLGLYTTAAYENEKWGVKIGIRLEDTQIETLLETTNEKHSKNYTNLFPSAHTSYTISDNFSLQAGYSRRINRPNLRSLNPFSNIKNNYSISTGNPDLQPEYTNSYELTSIHKIGKASLNFSLYNRYTTDVIENITEYADDISISRPENIGTSNTTGFEVNGKFSPANWFTMSGEFNINYFDRKGVFETEIFDYTGNRWTSSLTSQFKLPLDFDLEVSGDYQSKFKSLQGEVYDNLYAGLGLRKKILKGKVILNMSIRDVFASRINQSETVQDDYYLYNSRKRGRFVSFGVSYGFGKGEAMEFSGQRHR